MKRSFSQVARRLPRADSLQLAQAPSPYPPRWLAPSATFSTSSRRWREVQPGKSPWATFVDTLKEELEKNREFQESVKQVGGEVGKVQDSAALKRAGEMYQRMRLVASIKENPRLRKAAEELSKTGATVGDAVAEAVKQFEENRVVRAGRDALRRTSEAALRASEPIRNTEIYKSTASAVTEAFDDLNTNVKYGGYVDREARRRRRAKRLEKLGKSGLAASVRRVAVNPEAGDAVQLHATANAETWRDRMAARAPEPVVRLLNSVSDTYEASENPLISGVRTVASKVAGIFEETETARVVRKFKELDPSFQQEIFLRELREYIVPEVVDAYVSGDLPALQGWCSEAAFNVLASGLLPLIQQGLVPDCQVLDIRELDLVTAKMLENEIPVFLIRFTSQEILAYRNPVTRDVVVGDAASVAHVNYAAVITRKEETLDDSVTGGWQLVEMLRREN